MKIKNLKPLLGIALCLSTALSSDAQGSHRVDDFDTSHVYVIRSASSGRYLDGRGPHDNEKALVTYRQHIDNFFKWRIEPLGNGRYAFKSVSSHKYLDGRGPNDDSQALVTDRSPTGARGNYLQWEIWRLNNGNYAFKSVTSHKYLDGRGPEDDGNALVTDRNPTGPRGHFLQWTFSRTH